MACQGGIMSREELAEEFNKLKERYPALGDISVFLYAESNEDERTEDEKKMSKVDRLTLRQIWKHARAWNQNALGTCSPGLVMDVPVRCR